MFRISRPLLDRIDLHTDVPAVPYKEMSREASPEPSGQIRECIGQARNRQIERLGEDGVYANARMQPYHVHTPCSLTPEGDRILEKAVTQLRISALGWNRILKVARTIADLETADKIAPAHIAGAVRCLKLDRGET